jgi:arsenate reductase
MHFLFFDKNKHFPRQMDFLCSKKLRIMTNKIYYLASCDTCRKIIKTLPKNANLVFRDIKQDSISREELDEMVGLSGSYEALFSKKAILYKTLDLKNKNLTETDYKNYILEHYTFLSRPVFIIDNKIFIGNSQPVTLQVMKALT